MITWEHLTKTTLKEKLDYFVAQYRYWCYYNGKRHWLRDHIIEQYKWRIEEMDPQCYIEGQCKKCGCETTKLQFANRACDKPCYPAMMNKKDWKESKKD